MTQRGREGSQIRPHANGGGRTDTREKSRRQRARVNRLWKHLTKQGGGFRRPYRAHQGRAKRLLKYRRGCKEGHPTNKRGVKGQEEPLAGHC